MQQERRRWVAGGVNISDHRRLPPSTMNRGATPEYLKCFSQGGAGHLLSFFRPFQPHVCPQSAASLPSPEPNLRHFGLTAPRSGAVDQTAHCSTFRAQRRIRHAWPPKLPLRIQPETIKWSTKQQRADTHIFPPFSIPRGTGTDSDERSRIGKLRSSDN